MKKIGILTFHYSNNYGGVLQAISLQKTLELKGFSVEVVNYVPSDYAPTKVINNLGISKNIFNNKIKDLNIFKILKKISIMRKYSDRITEEFNSFRKKEMNLSQQVDEKLILGIMNNYDVIIVGSDQVWNPSQRRRPEYFLDFNNSFNGKKISYAADSTLKEVNHNDMDILKKSLNDFDFISVRNKHSFDFVEAITNKKPIIVADPTILIDFKSNNKEIQEEYILTYILGKEINGTHKEAIRKIKKRYGNLPVYSIKIPTMAFELPHESDKVFYDLGPNEWLNMFENAKFIYTDSYHGVLYSMKYSKPFLAYYTEVMRATRFIDLGERYNIDKYIVKSVEEIDVKKSLDIQPDFIQVKSLLKAHKEYSLRFLDAVLEKV